jgi:hypothetical protein
MPTEISNERKSNLGKGKLRVVKDREFPPFEDKEWYVGKFVDHTEFSGKFGTCLRLNFKVLRGEMANGTDAKGQKVSAMVTAELTPKSKLMNYIAVFSEGKDFDVDDVIDIKAYYGKIVKIFIENGKSKGENGKPYQNVTAVKEFKKKGE